MADHPLRNRRILCVEDEYYLAVQLERDLASSGATVLGPVPDVDQALALIGSEPIIDGAVLDMNLGGDMAHPVADALLARGIPFVITTGYSDGDLSRRYPDVTRCEKPVEFRTLEQALVALLHG